jgi:hypothetical protein
MESEATMHMKHRHEKTARRSAVWLAAAVALGLIGCNELAEPPHQETPDVHDHTPEPDEPGPVVVLDAEAPRPATAAEVAALAVARADLEPPPVPAAGPSIQSSASSAMAATCTIGFADYIGLLILPNQAGNTFALPPYYIQGCGSGWVHVKENDVARYGPSWGSGYGHYHLGYEVGGYCNPGGGYGVWIGNTCVRLNDPAAHPRELYSHLGDEWIRIYVYKSGVSEMTFDLRRITVNPTRPIRLWFRKASGAWYVWNNLGVGTWNLAQYSSGIREVLIRGAGNSALPYGFDDVVVRVN